MRAITACLLSATTESVRLASLKPLEELLGRVTEEDLKLLITRAQTECKAMYDARDSWTVDLSDDPEITEEVTFTPVSSILKKIYPCTDELIQNCKEVMEKRDENPQARALCENFQCKCAPGCMIHVVKGEREYVIAFPWEMMAGAMQIDGSDGFEFWLRKNHENRDYLVLDGSDSDSENATAAKNAKCS